MDPNLPLRVERSLPCDPHLPAPFQSPPKREPRVITRLRPLGARKAQRPPRVHPGHHRRHRHDCNPPLRSTIAIQGALKALQSKFQKCGKCVLVVNQFLAHLPLFRSGRRGRRTRTISSGAHWARWSLAKLFHFSRCRISTSTLHSRTALLSFPGRIHQITRTFLNVPSTGMLRSAAQSGINPMDKAYFGLVTRPSGTSWPRYYPQMKAVLTH